MEIDKIIQTIAGTDDEKKLEGFLRFLSDKLWNLYRDYIMDKVKVAENEINWNLNIPNAKENQEYMETIPIPEVKSSSALPGLGICLEEVSGETRINSDHFSRRKKFHNSRNSDTGRIQERRGYCGIHL